MFRTGSIQLARIAGIRIGVDTSWFLVLFLLIFVLSGSFRDTLDSSETVAYATAVASALLFFASLVLHELGHALAARRLGIQTTGIDLFFLGGIAKMSRDTESPGGEFQVAAAGPAVTVAVIVVCVTIGIGLVGPDRFYDAAILAENVDVSPGLLLLSWLASINALLFLFNLVPAFPLDGGRIMRAAAWKVTGNRAKATRFAAALGQGFAYLLMGFGVFLLVATGAFVSGLWMIVLGFVLGQGARAAVVQTAFTERLEGITVADIMDREPIAVPAGLPAERIQDDFFLRYGWPWFPVVDEQGRFTGVVRRERVEGAVVSGDRSRDATGLMDPGDAEYRIGQETLIENVLGSEPLRRLGGLAAVDDDGKLLGVVTLNQVRRALQAAAMPRPS